MDEDQIDTEIDAEHEAFMLWFMGSRDLLGVIPVKTAHNMEQAWRARATVSAWLPIETAPKYGDEIDIWASGERAPNCVFNKPTYGKQIGWVYQSGYDSDGPVFELVKNPTHWMPLPASPA